LGHLLLAFLGPFGFSLGFSCPLDVDIVFVAELQQLRKFTATALLQIIAHLLQVFWWFQVFYHIAALGVNSYLVERGKVLVGVLRLYEF
jgi:hypothetical protein